jgi:hypothetical protein
VLPSTSVNWTVTVPVGSTGHAGAGNLAASPADRVGRPPRAGHRLSQVGRRCRAGAARRASGPGLRALRGGSRGARAGHRDGLRRLVLR